MLEMSFLKCGFKVLKKVQFGYLDNFIEEIVKERQSNSGEEGLKAASFRYF